MTTLTCRTCGPKFDGCYNTDHRCITCGTIVLAAQDNDDEVHRLRRQVRDLTDALEMILDESEDLTYHEMAAARRALGRSE